MLACWTISRRSRISSTLMEGFAALLGCRGARSTNLRSPTSLHVSALKVQIDIFVIGSRDDIDAGGVAEHNPIAAPGRWWWFGRRSLFAGLGHLFVSLTRGAEGLDLLGGVVAGKGDDVAHAEDREQVICDRGGDQAAEGFGKMAIVGLLPADGVVARGGQCIRRAPCGPYPGLRGENADAAVMR